MAHLLLLEAPGGNDFTLVEDAMRLGHHVTFVTGERAQYEAQSPAVRAGLALATRIIEVHPFSQEALERAIEPLHATDPIEAVICMLDIRMLAASRLARKLGLRFLNPDTTGLARDKSRLRARLAEAGIRQARFARAETPADLPAAIAQTGLPAIVKPADGFASQNVHILRTAAEIDALVSALSDRPTDYGLGVAASGVLLVEQYLDGALIGCDVFSDGSSRALLGINDKALFPAPSFAMRGSCFPTQRHDTALIQDYAFAILDAIDFDFGAAHVEMIVTQDGPMLVEVNPRLVSAQIPHQMAYALRRSIYADLIALHLGEPAASFHGLAAACFSAIRWLSADQPGTLDHIAIPDQAPPEIRRVVFFKGEGEAVRPPVHNGDRIGYVIAVGAEEATAEAIADRYIADCRVALR